LATGPSVPSASLETVPICGPLSGDRPIRTSRGCGSHVEATWLLARALTSQPGRPMNNASGDPAPFRLGQRIGLPATVREEGELGV